MSNLNDFAGSYYILDFSRARVIQLTLCTVSVVGFVLYALALNYLCSSIVEPLSALFLLLAQVAVGVVTTRIFQSVGLVSAEKVVLAEPERLSPPWVSEAVSVSIKMADQIFEQIIEQASAEDHEVDDIIDYAWFTVIVWAIFTTSAVMLFSYISSVCMSAAGILAICSALCYHNGYRSKTGNDFDEDLEHLRYYAVTRISEMINQLSNENPTVLVHMLCNRDQLALSDIGISLRLPDIQEPHIEYWAGLSRNRPEAVEVILNSEVQPDVFHLLKKAPILQDSAWRMTKISSTAFQLAKESDSISISEPKSYISRVTQSTSGVEDIVSSMRLIWKEVGTAP